LSPLVQHKRALAPPRKSAGSHGSTRANMLLSAGLSSGVVALVVVFGILLTAVGVYTIVVWPLTFWDLASLQLEKYSSWTTTVVASVFAGGSLAGMCYFGGALSRRK
jgi:hypothetical protein